MNKILRTFLTSMILLALFIPLASAANFHVVEETLADIAILFAGEDNLTGIARDDMFWATLLVWGLVTALFSAAAKLNSTFQNRTGATMFIGAMLGFTAIRYPGTVAMVWGLTGLVLMIVILAVIVFLVLSVWRSSSTSSKKLGAESLEADKDLSEKRKELMEVQVDEKKAIQDEKLEMGALKGESKALKNAEKLAKKSFKFEADIMKKLLQMKKLLKEVESAGARDSPAAIAARQRVLNLIRVEIPTIKKKGKLLDKLKSLTGKLKKYQYAEFNDMANLNAVRNRIRAIRDRNPSLSIVTNDQVNVLATKVHKLQEIGRNLTTQLVTLEGKVEAEDTQFNALIQGVIESLEHGNISESLGHIQQALGMARTEETTLLQIERDLGELSGMEATMFNLLEQSMKLDEKNIRILFK